MGGQCTGRRNTKWGKNQGQRPALAKPPAEPTPSGASSPASLLRCLPVIPLCVLPRRGMTEATGVARSYKGETASGRPDSPPSAIRPGEACPPSASVDPCAGDIRGKSIPMPLSAAEPTYSLRGGGVRPADAAVPSAYQPFLMW